MIRKILDFIFKSVCFSFCIFSVSILVVLLTHILLEGMEWLSFDFLNQFSSRMPSRSGIKAAIYGTAWVVGLSTAICFPIGLLTAIYLEEYSSKEKSLLLRLLQINIMNLAGVPSIVYGLLGLLIFVRFLGLDRSVLSGSLTLALLCLPLIILVSQEALRAVPYTLREAAYALGARRWQVVFGQVVPAAFPGILTGIILSVSRIIGETSPLIVVGAVTYISFLPENIMSSFTVLPLQIYSWSTRPQEEFHQLAAAGIICLMVLLFFMNFIAIYIRHRLQRYR